MGGGAPPSLRRLRSGGAATPPCPGGLRGGG